MPVHVSSEIGPLRSVLVHVPGRELLAVTPDTREDYLYDDMIDVESAQREHRRFVAILERYSNVMRVTDLLAEVVGDPEVREFFIGGTLNVLSDVTFGDSLRALPDDEFVRVLVEGMEAKPGPLARTLNETGYMLPPVPNLFFTRDVAMVVNDSVLIGSMRYEVRWTEELIMKVLFHYHPALQSQGILYDGSLERRLNYSLEGGDVHILRRDTAMIGFSERSSPAAIEHLTEMLFERGDIENVIVVVMPKENAAIHLDMIFTQVDREQCAIFPPHFMGPERLSILLWRKGQSVLAEMPNVFAALSECGMPMEPVLVGGQNRISQEREQWASGANFCALRPGLVTAYARNHNTLREMENAGFRIIPAAAMLTGEQRVAEDERAVITFEGGELVRGGGGPRCMTCIVQRDDI